jgi:integrase/recombinase XerC
MSTIKRHESLSLIRDPKTPYLAFRFTIPGLPRSQRSTKESKVEAAWAKAKDAYEVAKLRARGDEPEPTLRGLVEQWVEAHTLGWSPSHCANVDRFGRLHLGALADVRISEVTTRMVEEARNEFLGTHEKSSANQWITYLKLVFRWAIDRRMIRQVPWKLGELKFKKRGKPRLSSESTEGWLGEVDALTEHDPGVGLVIRLMVGIGLRNSEARGARWEWLDLERAEYTPGDTKGGEAVPRPLPAWLLEDLRSMAKQCGPMVPTNSGKVVTPGRVQRIIDKACQSMGIQRLTPHRLRHTYATWLSEEGVPIQDIQAVLGHKDITTTAIYLGVDLSRVRKAQDNLALRLDLGRRKVGGVSTSKGRQC